MCGAGMRTFFWTSYAASPWSGYDELDTKLRAKGVQDGPKKKAMRQRFKASAAKAVLSGEMTVKDLSEELGIKDSTLRRWACEYEEMGDELLKEHRGEIGPIKKACG